MDETTDHDIKGRSMVDDYCHAACICRRNSTTLLMHLNSFPSYYHNLVSLSNLKVDSDSSLRVLQHMSCIMGNVGTAFF